MTQYNPRSQRGLPVVTSDVELHLEEREQLAALTEELEQADGAPAQQQVERLLEFLADPDHGQSAQAVVRMIRKGCARTPSSQGEILAELPPSHLDHLLTAEEASLFERQGFFVMRSVLQPDTVRTMQTVMEDLEVEYAARLNIGEHERVNLLDCLALDERLLELADHPATFPKVWGLMGWHIALYIAGSHSLSLRRDASGFDGGLCSHAVCNYVVHGERLRRRRWRHIFFHHSPPSRLRLRALLGGS
jgi:hypothetical protein